MGIDALIHELCLGSLERFESWQAAVRGLGASHFANFPRGPGADQKLRRFTQACQRSPTARQDDDWTAQSSATATEGAASKGQEIIEERGTMEARRGRRSNLRRRQQ